MFFSVCERVFVWLWPFTIPNGGRGVGVWGRGQGLWQVRATSFTAKAKVTAAALGLWETGIPPPHPRVENWKRVGEEEERYGGGLKRARGILPQSTHRGHRFPAEPSPSPHDL